VPTAHPSATPARVSGVPLLQVENLSQVVRDPAGAAARTVFASASFTLTAGEQVSIVGPRGAGKTQLTRALTLIEKPAGGRVLFEGQDITRAWGGRLRALRRSVQYVGGDARRSLSPRLDIAQVLAEPLQVHGLGSPAERRAQVAAAAQAWELNPLLLTQRASALSNALCQRVVLARSSLLQPRLLVVDELAERLEPAAVRPLLALVSRLCRAAGRAWLWTTTDAALANDYSDRVLELKDGKLQEREKEKERARDIHAGKR
jgi:peptide/nickel transport system ATP-binding protein